MIEVENVKVLLLEDADFQPCESDSGTAQLTPEADKKATLAEIVIFGDRLIKNRHALQIRPIDAMDNPCAIVNLHLQIQVPGVATRRK